MRAIPEDLTPEERQDCIEEYLDVFKNSSGSAVHEAQLRIRLKKLGIDRDEVDMLVRLNRPVGEGNESTRDSS